MSEARTAVLHRKTKETDIEIELNLDGEGSYGIETGIAFLDHMLESFAKHGLFDLEIKAQGDLAVDTHHTVEDVGISLGQAVRKALGSEFRIVCPGIRTPGSDRGDQVRAVTAYDAIRAGADYIVVGRPIRDAADPLEAARAISDEISRALAS